VKTVAGKKIRRAERLVPVRVRPPAPISEVAFVALRGAPGCKLGNNDVTASAEAAASLATATKRRSARSALAAMKPTAGQLGRRNTSSGAVEVGRESSAELLTDRRADQLVRLTMRAATVRG
jgi:hypothetical protein